VSRKLAASAFVVATLLAAPAVAAPLPAPICQNAAFSGAHDTQITGSVTCTQLTEFFAYILVSDAEHGHVVLESQTGNFVYTPNAGYSGPDSFTFTAIDRHEVRGNVATASLTVVGETTPPPPPPPPTTQPSPQGCPLDVLRLVDVRASRGHVVLAGETSAQHAGRNVTLQFVDKFVASAKVGPDGTFRTTVPLPPADIRATARARYRAVLGGLRSPSLKLARRMNLTTLASRGGKVTIGGRVAKPLADPIATVTLREYTNCRGHEHKVVKRNVKVDSDGRFEVTIPAPANADRAYYRALTKVRKNRDNPKTYPTFTLLRGVSLAR
jgi:Bacterial Ig domain